MLNKYIKEKHPAVYSSKFYFDNDENLVVKPKQFRFGFGRKFWPVSVSVFRFSPFSVFWPKHYFWPKQAVSAKSANFGRTFQYKVNCQNSPFVAEIRYFSRNRLFRPKK